MNAKLAVSTQTSNQKMSVKSFMDTVQWKQSAHLIANTNPDYIVPLAYKMTHLQSSMLHWLVFGRSDREQGA